MKKSIFGLFAAVLVMAATLKASAQDASQQTRNVSGYSKIGIGGPFKTRIIMGDKEGVVLNIDADYIDKVETVVENGALKVQFKKSTFNWSQSYNIKTANVTIYAKSLSGLANSGSGSVTVEGAISSPDFALALSGSGSINIPTVKATGEFKTTISGSGSITIAGSAPSVSAVISGSGEIKAKEFSTQNASVTISGSGNVYLKADKQINATLVGSGSVFYSGNAQVNSHKVGSGTVQKM
ncbi:head GIN domain-containing protein [Mucilaginibacter agri]|uniref:Putative auto-transporter adhesin head GIN domain-containing protein n=1 Tax=Mucilaginibacter agri TaxID=2695265 RepID=A0A965ZG72_9SPHI|nr:head GIN domain-containing protein [Mucilaginibacter agri]NCD70459.1 hypothetical protein [Mucilaginibacter agri]